MLWHYAARKNYESRPLIVMVYELVQVRVQVSSTNDGAQWHEKGSHSFSEWNFIVGYGRLTKIVIRFAFHFVIYFIYYTQTYIYISCLAFLHILFLVHSAHSINTLRISLQCSIWNWSIKSSVCLSLGTKLIAFHCMYFIVEKKKCTSIEHPLRISVDEISMILLCNVYAFKWRYWQRESVSRCLICQIERTMN